MEMKEWEVKLMHTPSGEVFECTAFARTADDAELCAFNTPPIIEEFGIGDEINPDDWEAEIVEIVEPEEDDED